MVDAGDRPTPPGWRRAWPLAVLAAALALLAGVGVLPRWGGLTHLVALPPLDLFADVRLLVAAAPSYPWLIAGVAASLAVRTAVLAVLLGGLRRNARLAATVYAVALLPALLAAIVQFSGQAGLYARIFWPGPMLAAVALAILGPVAWHGTDRFRTAIARTFRHGLRVDVVAPYAIALVALGAVGQAGGGTTALLATPASAALAFLAMRRLCAPAPPHLPVALAAVVIAATGLAWVFDQTRPETPQPAPHDAAGSLLLMSGINSASGQGAIFEIDPSVYGVDCERTFHYSYAGPGDGAPQGDSACPITTGAPYEGQDTQRPLDDLVNAFVLQTAVLPPPVTVIAHSQAPWIAWRALADHGELGVTRLVLLGPFPDNSLGYPPPGESGVGRVGGDGLRLVAATGQALGFKFEPDAPLAREMLARADASRQIFSKPLPDGVDVLEIPALVDLPLKPHGPGVDGARTVCSVRAAHPYLPYAQEVHVAMHRFHAGQPQAHCPRWRGWVGPAAQALAIPPLHTGASADA